MYAGEETRRGKSSRDSYPRSMQSWSTGASTTEMQKLLFHGKLYRDPAKIADLQSSYNKARDFIKNTGEGILAEDEANGIHNVQARILELCLYWDLLDPVMSDRSVTEPLHIRSSVGGDQPGRPGSPRMVSPILLNPSSHQFPPAPPDSISLGPQ
ncbi:hypothetical protein H4Q26_003942 [Puccinia striiformis f. sp. tritici PST-130]|nr:hypothetical protein H4Q26_003942 [Puccinia striiformis f. sp. tritici PST-130]